MIRNYFKTAWRTITKNKVYSFIHLIGLSTGVAACLLIFLFVRFELTFDQHNENYERIARITTTLKTPESDDLALATSPVPLADALLHEYPEVEAVARLDLSSAVIKYNNELLDESGFYKADQSVFSVFSFLSVAGELKNSLTEPNSVVLTESIAMKYFNNSEAAVGQTLVCNHQPYRVTAVVADLPANSDIRIEGLFSAEFSKVKGWLDESFPLYTFVLFKEEINLAKFEQKIQQLTKQYIQPELNASGAKDYSVYFSVEKLADVHFSKGKQIDRPKGNREINYLFSVLAGFILFIALLNYVNLSTAKAADRGKEVGIRKVSGAGQMQLISQFIVESFLIIGLAWIGAIGLLIVLIPYFNELLGTEISFVLKDNIFFLINVFLLTTFLTSIYPAFVLTVFSPIEVLKGKQKGSHSGGVLRKGIVVFQFVITVVLITSTMVVYRQIEYIMNSDQGFNTSQAVSISVPTEATHRSAVNTFIEELKKLPEIESFTVGNGVQENDLLLATTLGNNKGEKRHLFANYLFIDPDFIPFFGMQLLSGRNFSEGFITDKKEAFLVNEAFVSAMGWSEPIGQSLDSGVDRKGKVIGVVKNFHYKSMHNAVEPLVMVYRTDEPSYVTIKTQPENLAKVKTLWQGSFPDKVYDYSFLDEAYAVQYQKDTVTAYLFSYFTLLAILISCLGLYGLVALMISQRKKEIGIRKVLGANVTQVTGMLSMEFVKLALLASIIAFPIAWWGMNKWLDSFAYRIEISWWIFIIAGVISLMVALMTISFQTVKAALENPVKSLRTE